MTLYLYLGQNRDGFLVTRVINGVSQSRGRIYVGGAPFPTMNEGQLDALVRLAMGVQNPVSKGTKVVFFDGDRWARTNRRYAVLRHIVTTD